MSISPLSRLVIFVIVAVIGGARWADAQRPDELVKLAVRVVPPEYPYEARRSRIEGHGILVGEVDYDSGKVTSVKMERSTGSRILDQASLSAFRRWQFRPKSIRQFRTPLNFEMVGSQAEAMEKMRRDQAAPKQGSR